MSQKFNATSTHIKVVKVNTAQDNFTLYIGREWLDVLPQSPLHNPFRIGKDGTRAEVLGKFAHYWYAPEQAKLRAYALTRIANYEILGCWCRTAIMSYCPLWCHGDIIAGYIAWKRQEASLW